MRHLFSSSPSFSDDDEYYYARAVRYIYRDSREKTERKSPLLHREMIGCSAVVANLLIIVVKNPRSLKECVHFRIFSPQNFKLFCSLSLLHTTQRAQ